MENKEVIERFANRLENAIDRADIMSVSPDMESIEAIAMATVMVEQIVENLRSSSQEGEKA